MSSTLKTEEGKTPVLQALVPVTILVVLIVYGLIVRSLLEQPQLPLEIIFILSAAGTVLQLMLLGHHWSAIQNTIVAKFQQVLPAFFILFCIGLVIASWIVSGTIPMLVYFGLKSIDPTYLYVLSFLAPVVFSTTTGTSWGSVGTIGVVLIGIATALEANLGVTAGAVIGGACFGDKLSPLSDTTNMAALGADVDLYEHIRSMLWTTLPAAVIAAGIYFCLGYVYPPAIGEGKLSQLDPVLNSLDSMFTFSWWLLLPALTVLVGSLLRLPTVPVLIVSIVIACVLSLVFQQFSVTDIMASLHRGFDVSMAPWVDDVPEKVQILLNRGGLYELNDAIVIAFMVFVFIGAMDHIRAMPTVVQFFLKSITSPRSTVLGTLLVTAITNALTSSQYATSFIVGDAFKSKYDAQEIDRTVLSRSLEDTGTMLESIVPWHPTAVYMGTTLGVACSQYWYWQCLSLVNIVIAVLVAATGFGLTRSTISSKTE